MIDGYTLFLLKRHEQRVSVNGLTIIPKYDTIGRNQGREIHFGADKLAEEHISYRKVGDHATNMPSTVRFGNRIDGEFVLRDSLKYHKKH